MNKLKLYKDGKDWCCIDEDFKNPMESPQGFGSTKNDAIIGYKNSKREFEVAKFDEAISTKKAYIWLLMGEIIKTGDILMSSDLPGLSRALIELDKLFDKKYKISETVESDLKKLELKAWSDEA